MSGILPTFWTPSGLRTKQNDLLTEAKGIDQGVQACAKANVTTKTQWELWYVNYQKFAAIDFGWITTTDADGMHAGGGTGQTADELEKYEKDLADWKTQLVAQGCTISTPTNTDDKPSGDKIVQALKWAAIGLSAVAGAVVVSKAVDLVRDFTPRR